MSFEQMLKLFIWYIKNLDILLCIAFIVSPLLSVIDMSGGEKVATILFGLACGSIRVWRIMRKKKQ